MKKPEGRSHKESLIAKSLGIRSNSSARIINKNRTTQPNNYYSRLHVVNENMGRPPLGFKNSTANIAVSGYAASTSAVSEKHGSPHHAKNRDSMSRPNYMTTASED